MKPFRLASSSFFVSFPSAVYFYFSAPDASRKSFFTFYCSIERGRRKLETLCSPVGASLVHFCLCVLHFTRIRVWYACLAALLIVPFILSSTAQSGQSCLSLPSTVLLEAPLGTLGLCYPLLLHRCTALIACLGGQSLAIAPQFIHRRHVSVATTLFDSLFAIAYWPLSSVQCLMCNVACIFHLRWRLHAPSYQSLSLSLAPGLLHASHSAQSLLACFIISSPLISCHFMSFLALHLCTSFCY